MTKPIKTSQMIPDDGGIDKVIEKLELLKKKYEELAKTINQTVKSLSPTNKDDQKKISNIAKEVADLREKYSGTDEQLKKLIRTKEAYETRATTAAQQSRKYQEELKKEERYMRTNVKADIARKGTIEALEAETNKMIAQRKRLQILDTATGQVIQKNTKEYRRLTSQIKANTDQLKKFDVAIGRSQRFVGQYARAMSGLWNQVRLLAASYLGFYGAIRLGRNLIETFSGFESKMAGVRAITEATDEEFKALEQDARRLGGATIFTSQQVADLQTEFGKLGFSTQEIIDATEATLGLAAATDEGLAESAAVAGATLRAFNLQASETQRMVDVMARSFTSSALNLEKFKESMKFVAPIAAKANFSIEGTTAILGKLADAGLYGSLAGTGLRNIILRLSDASSTLSKRLGSTVNSFDEFIPAMKKLAAEGVDLSEALGLTDKRAVTAFVNILSNTKGIEILYEKLQDATGAAKEMANIRMDTLAGDAKVAVSALQEFAIVIGDQVKGRMREFVQGFTDMIIVLKENGEAIKNFIKFVMLVISSLISFRIATVAANLTGKLFGATFINTARTMGLYTAATIRARQATQALTVAMKANWFGLLATAVATLLTYLWLYEDRAKEATERQKTWNEQMAEAIAPAESLFETLKKVNPGTELHTELIKKINAEYGDYIENLLDEKSSLEDIEKAQVEVNKRLLENLAIKNQSNEIAAINKETLQRENDQLQQLADTYGKNVRNIGAAYRQALKGDFSDIDALFGNLQEKIINVGDTQIKIPGLEYVKERIQELIQARKQDEYSIEQILAKYSMYITTVEGEVIPEEDKLIWTLEKLRQKKKELIDLAEVIPENEVKQYRDAAKEIAEYTARIEFLENILDPKKGRKKTTKDKRLDQEKELQEMIIRNKYEGMQEEIKLEGIKLDYEKKKAQEEIQDKSILFKYLEQLQVEHEQKITEIRQKYREQQLNDALEDVSNEKTIFDQQQELAENAFIRRQQYIKDDFMQKRRFSNEITKFEKKQQEDLQRFQLNQQIQTLQNEINVKQKQMELRNEYLQYVLNTNDTLTESAKERMIKEIAYNETSTKEQIENLKELIDKTKSEVDSVGKDGEIKDIYDLVGLNLESGQKQSIKSTADFVVDQVTRVADAKVDAAKRAVEAAQREVDAAENSYNRQVELQAAGLANSTETAKRNLELAQQQQEKALSAERQAAVERERINSIQQASNLLVASSKVFAEWGFPGALPFLAAMWGSWLYATVRVKQLTEQQYGEGGYEDLIGGSHESGHDIDIGRTKDGRRRKAEGGEGLAVFNKRSTRRYKDRIPKIVRAINSQRLDEYVNENINFTNNSVDNNSTVFIPESKHVKAIRKTVDKMGQRSDGKVFHRGITTRYRK